ncbi:MAG: glycosyltransferase family 2 protein [bacterium]|nr:glycosyltransferase family 2 protein [bacterium]
MPKVSVIIPTYNYASFIAEAVESVLDQTFKDLEIIVVDDGSTDTTRDILKRFEGKITYLYQENQGAPAARNKGIKAAQGKYIGLLDADDFWMPEKLEIQVPILDQEPEVGLVYANVYNINLLQGNQFLGRVSKKGLRGEPFHELLKGNFIPSPSVLVRRACFEKVGLFDENLGRLAAQDWDMWLRIARVYKVAYVDRPLANYRFHDRNMTTDLERIKAGQVYVLDKIFSDSSRKDLPPKSALYYSYIYYHVGEVYYSLGEQNKARENLMKSIRFFPYRWKAYLTLMKSLLGNRVTAYLRR